jgi:hypothetical protein
MVVAGLLLGVQQSRLFGLEMLFAEKRFGGLELHY